MIHANPGKIPPRPSLISAIIGFIGGTLAIGLLALMTQQTSTMLLLGSFGASCVLVFGVPQSPFSQPRNVIFGHLICSLIGLIYVSLLGFHWWVVALAVGSAIFFMMVTNTVHPPAGSNPVIVFLTQPFWDFLVFPTLVGAIILVIVGLIYHRILGNKYPSHW